MVMTDTFGMAERVVVLGLSADTLTSNVSLLLLAVAFTLGGVYVPSWCLWLSGMGAAVS